MTLLEVINKLDSFDEESTIYVSEPWTTWSQAVVCKEPEDGGLPKEAAGMKYFLEIFIIKEFLEGWKEGKGKTVEEKCDRIIYYAENDA